MISGALPPEKSGYHMRKLQIAVGDRVKLTSAEVELLRYFAEEDPDTLHGIVRILEKAAGRG